MASALKIKDLPSESRPREAFMRSADPIRDMTDAMLLAILIRTGQKGSNAIDLANRLILHFKGADKLIDATWQQIVAAKVPGVGKVVAVQLAAAFVFAKRNARLSQKAYRRPIDTSDAAVRQVLAVGVDEKQENVFALYLDSSRHLLCEPKLVYKGGLDVSPLHPRDIFRQAIRLGAASLIVVHTHPSGNAMPSEEDIVVTKRLIEVGSLAGIPLDDHIVIGVGSDCHVSIRGLEKLDFENGQTTKTPEAGVG